MMMMFSCCCCMSKSFWRELPTFSARLNTFAHILIIFKLILMTLYLGFQVIFFMFFVSLLPPRSSLARFIQQKHLSCLRPFESLANTTCKSEPWNRPHKIEDNPLPSLSTRGLVFILKSTSITIP